VLYATTAALSAIALIAVRHPSINSWTIAAIAPAVLTGSALRLGSLRSHTPMPHQISADKHSIEKNLQANAATVILDR
jgi:uncharacterized membrane protein YeiH